MISNRNEVDTNETDKMRLSESSLELCLSTGSDWYTYSCKIYQPNPILR